MANKRKFTITTFREAVRASNGIKSEVARKLKCSRQTVDTYLKKYPELQDELVKARDSFVDEAESRLMKAVKKNNLTAILFTLETLGKNRGWSKRTEITGIDGENVLKLPPEMVDTLRVLGLSAQDVMREFEALLKLQAAQMAGAG